MSSTLHTCPGCEMHARTHFGESGRDPRATPGRGKAERFETVVLGSNGRELDGFDGFRLVYGARETVAAL